jgi:hypothetical protein
LWPFGIFYGNVAVIFSFFLKKEVARGGERTRVLSISFIFSFFTTLPLSHSGSPVIFSLFWYVAQRKIWHPWLRLDFMASALLL